MNKILLTGFEAFAGNALNPTEQLMKELAKSNHQTLILPVSFSKSWEELHQYIKEKKPRWIISCGVAAKRDTIDLERVAINLMDAGIRDNDGFLPQELKILQDAPDSYLSEISLNKWKAELEEDFPVKVSLSAGSYVCNYIYYQLMHHRTQFQYQCLFVHFPYPQKELSLAMYKSFVEKLLRIVESSNFE